MRQSPPTGQWMVSTDDVRWFFASGSVALDFAYTGDGFVGTAGAAGAGDAARPVKLARDAVPAHPPDPAQSPAQLGAWLSARFPEVGAAVGARELTDANALRSAIAHVATAVSRGKSLPGDEVDVINLFAATPDIPPALAGGGRRAGSSTARSGQALSAIAREAVGLFSGDSTARIRECAADDCHYIFYDESRSNNRRWCSMQRCGNRAKVRAHRARSTA